MLNNQTFFLTSEFVWIDSNFFDRSVCWSNVLLDDLGKYRTGSVATCAKIIDLKLRLK